MLFFYPAALDDSLPVGLIANIPTVLVNDSGRLLALKRENQVCGQHLTIIVDLEVTKAVDDGRLFWFLPLGGSIGFPAPRFRGTKTFPGAAAARG